MPLVTHKIALKPTPVQENYFRKACGCTRFAYNWALAEWDRQHRNGEKPNWMALNKKLNALKRTAFPWMSELSKWVPQAAVMNLGHAFAALFAGVSDHPRFKKKGYGGDSFFAGQAYKNEITVVGRRVKLPKIGWIRTHETLRFAGTLRRATVSCVAGRWFVSLLVDTPDMKLADHTHESVGVDLGVNKLAVLSNGEEFPGPKPRRRCLVKLKRLMRSLSRKQTGSANRAKAKLKVARCHAHVANVRVDYLHKLTFYLVHKFRRINIEDLHVAGMVRNRRLAAALGDQGFGTFRHQLTYKASWYGSELRTVGRFFPSSKTCSRCGSIRPKIALSVRVFSCDQCGMRLCRDLNAAINIEKAAGVVVTACGADSAGPARKHRTKLSATKQEPSFDLRSRSS